MTEESIPTVKDYAQIIVAPPGKGLAAADAVTRGAAALRAFATEFERRAEQDLAALNAAFSALIAADRQRATTTLEALYRASHELRGQAGSFGRELASAVADRLCHFIEQLREQILQADAEALEGVRIHVAAITLIFTKPAGIYGGRADEALLRGLDTLRERLGPTNK